MRKLSVTPEKNSRTYSAQSLLFSLNAKIGLVPECNSGFGEVVGGKLDVDFVAHADANEMLAHFA